MRAKIARLFISNNINYPFKLESWTSMKVAVWGWGKGLDWQFPSHHPLLNSCQIPQAQFSFHPYFVRLMYQTKSLECCRFRWKLVQKHFCFWNSYSQLKLPWKMQLIAEYYIQGCCLMWTVDLTNKDIHLCFHLLN